MSVLVYGLSHRTAPVGLLERLAVPPDRLAKALDDVLGRDHVAEAVVLSTCNRVEVYATVSRYHGGVADLRNFLAEWAGVAIDDLAPLAYDYYEERAASHLFAVAAGLDSMVVGERQIHGQVRAAFKEAQAHDAVGRMLGTLFRQSMRVAKRARVETDVEAGGATMVDVGLAAADRGLTRPLDECAALVIGAGQMGGIAATRLADAGARVTVANRSPDKAARLAERVGAATVEMSQLRTALADADLVVTSTGASAPLVSFEDVEAAKAGGGDRRLVLLDLAVPRDVDPGCGGIEEVYLYDIDTLEQLAEAARGRRQRQIEVCESIIDAELAKVQLPGL